MRQENTDAAVTAKQVINSFNLICITSIHRTQSVEITL